MTISNVIRILKEALEGDREQREMLPKLQREADRAWRRADRRVERARLGAQSAMGILEKIRINVLAVQMDEFLHEYEELKNVHLEDCSGYIDLRAAPLDQKRLHTLVDMYDRIRDAGTVGYSARSESTMLFGPGLLTWYARTPDFHFDEDTLKNGSIEELHGVITELDAFGHKVTEICSRLQSIHHAAQKAAEVMYDLGDLLDDCTEDIRRLQRSSGRDWSKYTMNEKISVARGVQIAELIQDMADFHVLNEDATVKESLVNASRHARDVIHQIGA